MPTPYKAFAAILYYHLIHTGKHRVDEVAARMSISASMLYKYCEGDANFPIDLLPRLYNATQEPEFLSFILKDTDQTLTPRAACAQQPRTLELEALDVVTAVGELSARVTLAVEDGAISEIETRRIENIISNLHHEIEQVRMKVRAGKAA